ncbi:Pv-fam-d protein [Plasmodium cynomolgi strain B]|uniref:Pv-fam-d protein n=1 Tax=Plasmodium cynomolgi (strain B) TaxID=1120755 RepID=K6V8X6_PLACD|nr:Pv-fam-d protein [Plasmodium cynomolgi strain B]GAB65592.1 Pv-fam-d protein [Plasmodium cynomolgi strain B]
MTKKRYNPKTIENYRRNYHIDNNLFVENESESLTGCHMGDQTHAASTFRESWVNRGSLNALGVRSSRVLIGDANISIEPNYELFDDREEDGLRENYHSPKKHLHEIFLDSNFQKHLDDSINNNRCVRKDNMQASENGNNDRSMTRESFDSLSFDNDFNQSNETPNDQNQLEMRSDAMQDYINVKEDIDDKEMDESFVNSCIYLENDSRNANNKGLNPNYNSLMNDKESSGSANVDKEDSSSSPGAGDNISSKRLEALNNDNNFKENCDETELDEDFEMNYSSLQFDSHENRKLDNFKSNDNVNNNVAFEKMKDSNSSSSKQFDVESVNVSFDESHDTLKQYSDFQDKVNNIKIDDDFKGGFYSLKRASNLNASFGKIKGDINRNQGFNKNNNVPSAANFEQNYEELSNNEDSDIRPDSLKNYNDFMGEVNAETLDDDFEKGYMALNPDDGVNTQVEPQRADAKEVNEIADKFQNEDNLGNIFEKYMGYNEFKELHSLLMRTVNMDKHFDKINDNDNYGKKYNSLIFDGSAAHNPQDEQNSDENSDHLDEKDSEKTLNALEHYNAFTGQVNGEKLDDAFENEFNRLWDHDIFKNGEYPSKGTPQNGKKKSGKMNGGNNASRRFEGSRRDQNNYNNPVNRSPVDGINYNNRNNIYRNNRSDRQIPLDVLISEQDYSYEFFDIFNGMNKFGKQIDLSKLYENSDNEQSYGSKSEDDGNDDCEYAGDEYEDEHAEGEYKRYDENNKRDYDAQGVYRYDDNRINVLKQDEIARESQELGKYNDRTETVTTVLESTGNAIEQFDGTLKDNASIKEQLNDAKNYQDNKQFGKSKDEERVSITYDELDDDTISSISHKSEYDDKRSYVTYKSRRIDETYNGAIHKSKMADDQRSDLTKKLKRIDDRDSDIHDHSKYGDRNGDKNDDGNDDKSDDGNDDKSDDGNEDKSDDKDSFIDGSSKNDDYTSTISDNSMDDRNKRNSHTFKKDNANFKKVTTEAINTDNDQNKLLNAMQLTEDFKRKFNILKNAGATEKRCDALKHYERFKKEILNIQLERDFVHGVNRLKPRCNNKKLLYASTEEYEDSCDSSEDEDYSDSQSDRYTNDDEDKTNCDNTLIEDYSDSQSDRLTNDDRNKKEPNMEKEDNYSDGQSDRLTHDDRNKKESNMEKKDNYSDNQSDILGRNNRDKKELDKKKGGKYYEDTHSIRDNYDSKSQCSVLKKKSSPKKSCDKSNIDTDFDNSRRSFELSKDNKLVKKRSEKSKDGSVCYGSKKSLGVRKDGNMEKKNLDKINDHDDYYYGSKQSFVSSKVNNDVSNKTYDKSRDTTDKSETRSLYSVLSRNRYRNSHDKPGAPSDYYGSKASFNASKENKMVKNISDKPNEVCDSAKASNVLKNTDSSSKRSVNKINNEKKGKGNDKVDSHSVKSSHSLKDKPQDKNKSSNSLKSDHSNLDDLYDELDDAYTMNKRHEALKYNKEDFYKLYDDLKYDEKEFDTLYKVVESYEKVDKKKSNRSRDNDNNSVKSDEESEKDNDSLKSAYTFKRKSFAHKKSDLLKRNDKTMEIEQTFRRSEQDFINPDEFRRDRNYKDSNDKERNNREDDYRGDNNRRDDRRRDDRRRDDRRRDDRRRDDRRRDDRRRDDRRKDDRRKDDRIRNNNRRWDDDKGMDDNRRNHNVKTRNRRNDIDVDYERSLGNIKRNKKSFIKKVFTERDENEPVKSRMFNKKSLFIKTLKFMQKIDSKFELEIIKSLKSSKRSDTFLIKPETKLNKFFYYAKKYKILFPILLTLLCLFIFYVANLSNLAFGTVFVLLGMILYYNTKLLKCREMGKLFRSFSESNKFEIS